MWRQIPDIALISQWSDHIAYTAEVESVLLDTGQHCRLYCTVLFSVPSCLLPSTRTICRGSLRLYTELGLYESWETTQLCMCGAVCAVQVLTTQRKKKTMMFLIRVVVDAESILGTGCKVGTHSYFQRDMSPTGMFLRGGRKPKNPEEIHSDTGRTYTMPPDGALTRILVLLRVAF